VPAGAGERFAHGEREPARGTAATTMRSER
jgi:hypothetical protein